MREKREREKTTRRLEEENPRREVPEDKGRKEGFEVVEAEFGLRKAEENGRKGSHKSTPETKNKVS